MAAKFSRRTILIGATAGAAAVAGGAYWFATSEFRSSALAYLKRSLPGVPIDEESAIACIEDFAASKPLFKSAALRSGWSIAGVENMSELNTQFQHQERFFLTYFLLNSNFFYEDDPKAQSIVYATPPKIVACGNPFANLDPPDQLS
jgi:hypothetical protein